MPTDHACAHGNDARVLDELLHRVVRLETYLSERLPSIEDKVHELREILTRRCKAHLVVAEVAELLGRTPYTIRRWIKTGKLNAIRVADGGPRGRLLIPRTEMDRLIGTGKGGELPGAVLD